MKFNKVIMLLTTSDIFTWGLMTVVLSIIGIYISLKLNGDAVEIVGIGTGIYSLARGLFQIPMGLLVDRTKSDKDDILILFLGSVCMGFPFLLFNLIEEEVAYYFLQFVIGFGSSMNIVTWRKLFASNLDKNHEGLEYGIYDTVMSIAIAVFSVIAGVVASLSEESFDFVIAMIGILMISSGVWPLLIFKIKRKKL